MAPEFFILRCPIAWPQWCQTWRIGATFSADNDEIWIILRDTIPADVKELHARWNLSEIDRMINPPTQY